MPIIEIPILAQLYYEGVISDEHIILTYGQEALDTIIQFLTDPFNEVLGG